MATCAQPGEDWTVVLRRQPARIVQSRAEGGHTDAFEIICCDCGDHPGLDDVAVSPELQRIRGRYPIEAGGGAGENHLGLHQEPEVAHRTETMTDAG
jgi:hypothetical protein